MNADTREAIREAVLDGRITVDDAAAMWAAEDPHHRVVQQAAQLVDDQADADGM